MLVLLFSFTLAAAPEACVLQKPLKVFDKGAWSTLDKGRAVAITQRGAQWADLDVDGKAVRAATPALEAACPSSPALAPPAALPATPATPEAAAAAAPPVSAEVAPPDAPAPPTTTTTAAAPSEAAPEPTPSPVVEAPASAPAVLEAPSAPLVAVSDVRAGAGLESVGRALTTVLAAEIGALEGFRAVAPNELRTLVAHQADASLLGCDSVNCLANVAKLADAELIATGVIDRVDGALVLSLSLIEPAGPSVKARQEAVWRGNDDDLLALVRPLAQRLLAGPEGQRHRGALEIVAPEGALVVVDGREVGRAPLASKLADLETGAHTLRVELDGFLPHQGDVVVAHNETTVARVALDEISLFERPWFWVATGSAALVAGGAAAGLTAWALLSQQKDTTVVLAPKP